MIRGEGVAALMKGSITFSLKRVADWSSRFLFAVMAEDWLFKKGDAVRLCFGFCGLACLHYTWWCVNGREWVRPPTPFLTPSTDHSPQCHATHIHTQTYQLTNGEKLTASLVGGVVSSAFTLPLDVMVAQIQQASKAVRASPPSALVFGCLCIGDLAAPHNRQTNKQTNNEGS